MGSRKQCRAAAAASSSSSAAASASSSATSSATTKLQDFDSVTTILTITIGGNLEGPPPFDEAAFKKVLGKKLDMHKQYFQVRHLLRKVGSSVPHQVSADSGFSIDEIMVRVDVDEDAWTAYKESERASSSSNNGGDVSKVTDEDKEIFEATVTRAIKKALTPYRSTLHGIEVLWTKQG